MVINHWALKKNQLDEAKSSTIPRAWSLETGYKHAILVSCALRAKRSFKMFLFEQTKMTTTLVKVVSRRGFLLYCTYSMITIVQQLVSISTKHFLIACFHKCIIIPTYWLLALIHNCKDWIGLWQLFRLDHQGDQVHNCTIKVISQSVRKSNRLKGAQRHSRRH